MNPSRRIAVIAPVAIVLALGATSAFAGTTGTEFQTMYTTLLNWATGYLGVFALFMVYVPTIIDSIMTATI